MPNSKNGVPVVVGYGGEGAHKSSAPEKKKGPPPLKRFSRRLFDAQAAFTGVEPAAVGCSFSKVRAGRKKPPHWSSSSSSSAATAQQHQPAGSARLPSSSARQQRASNNEGEQREEPFFEKESYAQHFVNRWGQNTYWHAAAVREERKKRQESFNVKWNALLYSQVYGGPQPQTRILSCHHDEGQPPQGGASKKSVAAAEGPLVKVVPDSRATDRQAAEALVVKPTCKSTGAEPIPPPALAPHLLPRKPLPPPAFEGTGASSAEGPQRQRPSSSTPQATTSRPRPVSARTSRSTRSDSKWQSARPLSATTRRPTASSLSSQVQSNSQVQRTAHHAAPPVVASAAIPEEDDDDEVDAALREALTSERVTAPTPTFASRVPTFATDQQTNDWQLLRGVVGVNPTARVQPAATDTVWLHDDTPSASQSPHDRLPRRPQTARTYRPSSSSGLVPAPPQHGPCHPTAAVQQQRPSSARGPRVGFDADHTPVGTAVPRRCADNSRWLDRGVSPTLTTSPSPSPSPNRYQRRETEEGERRPHNAATAAGGGHQLLFFEGQKGNRPGVVPLVSPLPNTEANIARAKKQRVMLSIRQSQCW